MDNLCHTLVGAALGRAGIARRTALAMPTALIGANLPDVDVVAVPLGHALLWRRGITHGVPALVVLPLLLAGGMLLWDRLVRRRGGRAPERPAVPREILLLSVLSVLTHPVLDWMNTYGMRWWLPFDGRWTYGDALFIVDPWMWTALAAGVIAARRRSAGSARLALGAVAAYALAMLAAGRLGRTVVARELAAAGAGGAAVVLVGPVPVNPFRRQVVLDEGHAYRAGTLRWTPRPRLEMSPRVRPKNLDHPAVAAAAADPAMRDFLAWARFPYFTVERRADGTLVRADDARYSSGEGASWAATAVLLPPRAVP